MSTTRRRLAAALTIILACSLLLLTLSAAKSSAPQSATAAIVNLDEPVTIDGQLAPLGRQLAAKLVEQDSVFDWQITTAEKAKDGLVDGTYSALVTIPKEFSTAASSFSSPDSVQQAEVDVKMPPGATDSDRAAVELATSAATDALSRQLSQTFVYSMLNGFGDLQSELGSATDGATKLAGGATQSATGTKLLADGTGQLIDGIGQLAQGAEAGATGAGALAQGLDQLHAGTSQMVSLTAGLDTAMADMTSGLNDFVGILNSQSTILDPAATSAVTLATNAAALAAAITALQVTTGNVVATTTTASTQAKEFADQMQTFCVANPAADICGADQQASLAKVVEATDASATAAAGLNDEVGALSETATSVAKDSGELAYSVTAAALTAKAIAQAGATMSTQTASGLGQISQLTTALTGLDTSVGALSTGASQLATGTTALAGGLTTVYSQSGTLVDAFAALTAGSQTLADGVGDLANGLGTAVDKIPAYTASESTNMADGASQPVAAPTVTSGVSTLGALSMVLLLWLMSFVLLMVYPPFTKHSVTSVTSAMKMTFTAWYRPSRWAAIAGAVSGLALGIWASASFVDILTTILIGALIAIVFVTVQQALVAAAGIFGRIIAIAILVLATFAGVSALSSYNSLLPTGVAEQTLRWLTVSNAPSGSSALVGLLAWAGASFLVTVWATARLRGNPGKALLQVEAS